MTELHLTPEIEERLEALSRATGLSHQALAFAAIESYLEDLEDTLIAERRLSDLEAGRSHTVPLEKLMKDYGLAD